LLLVLSAEDLGLFFFDLFGPFGSNELAEKLLMVELGAEKAQVADGHVRDDGEIEENRQKDGCYQGPAEDQCGLTGWRQSAEDRDLEEDEVEGDLIDSVLHIDEPVLPLGLSPDQ